MKENILDRLKKYIKYAGISVRALEIKCGFSNGSVSSRLKENYILKSEEKFKDSLDKDSKTKTIGVDRLEKILEIYTDLNGYWLLTGIGDMIKSEKEYLYTEEERIAGELISSEVEYLRTIIKTKDEFIKKLQEELANCKNNHK